MLRYGIFFMLIAVMTFLVLYDKNGDFNSLYRDIVTPLGWTTIKIVDEKSALAEMLTERDSWTAVEQLLMAATAIVIGVTIGWRAHRYCDGTYFQSDLLVKFAGKQKHIQERLNNLEVKMDKFEMKHSADTESGDEGDSVTLHARDVSGQRVAEIEDRTSDTISHPSSAAVDGTVEDGASQTISKPSSTAVDETVEDRTSKTINHPPSTAVEDRGSQTISHPSSTVVDEPVDDRTSQTISHPSSTAVDETVEDRASQTTSQPSSTAVDEPVDDRASQTISQPSSTAVDEPVEDDRASQTISHHSSTAVEETVEDLVSTGTTMVAWDSPGPVECAEQDMTPEAEEETAKMDYEVDVFLYPIEIKPLQFDPPLDYEKITTSDSTEAEETVAGGAGECENKASPQECRVSQFQVLRAADHEVRQVGLSSCPTRILEPVKILTEVTKLPRPNSARKLVPDGVAATTNGRRRKPKNFQMK